VAKMRGINQLVLELLTLLLLLCEARVLVSGRTHVHVQNKVGSDVIVHCKSKDDDLGLHTISNEQEYQWSFKPNIFETTLFYCYVSWARAPDFSFGFEAYNFRDRFSCTGSTNGSNHDCYWLFAPDGVYLSDAETNTWNFRYPWPKPTP
jgi:hypothetical protein